MARPRPTARLLAAMTMVATLATTGVAAGAAVAAPALQPLRIALDFTPNVDYLGIYVAIDKGFFTRYGIKAEIIPYTGTPAETLLRTGKTDLGLTYPPNIPAYRAAGLRYRAVAGLTQVNTIALAVLASSRYRSPAQLSGKLYGGFGVPSDPPIIETLMRRAGVKHPEFKQVVLQTSAYQALAAGRVAYTTVFGGIDDVTARLQGVKLREFPLVRYLGAAASFPDDAFVATDAEIAGKAGLLRRGLAALSQGYRYAVAHPAEAERILIDDNRTALAHAANIVTATGNAFLPTVLDHNREWGALRTSQFSGLTSILAAAHQFKGRPPSPAGDFTDSLLPGHS